MHLALDAEWRTRARREIERGTRDVIAARAPKGPGRSDLARWMTTLAALATTDGHPLPGVCIAYARAFDLPAVFVVPQSLSSRFSRAGLPPPRRWILAYRLAIMGAMFAQGADVMVTSYVAGLTSPSHLYRVMSRGESMLPQRRRLRTAVIAETMRREDVGWAFARYVVPIVPRRADAWRATLAPSVSLSQEVA